MQKNDENIWAKPEPGRIKISQTKAAGERSRHPPRPNRSGSVIRIITSDADDFRNLMGTSLSTETSLRKFSRRSCQ